VAGARAVVSGQGARNGLDHPWAGEPHDGALDGGTDVGAAADGHPDPARRRLVRDGDVEHACRGEAPDAERRPRHPDEGRHALLQTGTAAAQQRHQRQLLIDGGVDGGEEGCRVTFAEAAALDAEVPRGHDCPDLAELRVPPAHRLPSGVARPVQGVDRLSGLGLEPDRPSSRRRQSLAPSAMAATSSLG
jgi:hypothetical protein